MLGAGLASHADDLNLPTGDGLILEERMLSCPELFPSCQGADVMEATLVPS